MIARAPAQALRSPPALPSSPAVSLDREACYRALQTRDERFDGRLFVGVTSTGIYCRPVCPARPPKPENCRFFPSAAAAQEAGFRPCLRCRPETGPEVASWRGTSNTVTRALALIAAGDLDGVEANVDRLAERLGVGGRQLRRLFQRHLGASPLAVAQTRRVLFAKQLIHETRLPMAEIALAAGFGSVRRFNETFQTMFHRPPSELRRTHPGNRAEDPRDTAVMVRLRYRAPYDFDSMLGHLAVRAVDGVEWVGDGVYGRTVLHEGETGTVEIAHEPRSRSLVATMRLPHVAALPGVVTRIRRVFDLSADVALIGAHLSRDPALAPLVNARPGLRVAGGWDGFELGVRAVLGQQVTVAAARRLLGQLTALCGVPTRADAGRASFAFPTAERVARADLDRLGVPAARRRTLANLAAAARDDPRLFEPLGSVEETAARLRAIPGVGEWTAQYIALRAAREPDAFPCGDRGLLRGAALRFGVELRPAELLARAEAWRPWRAYAAEHLWRCDGSAARWPARAMTG